MFKEITVVCYENHTKHTKAVCGQNTFAGVQECGRHTYIFLAFKGLESNK
jgi:hypothetical protein